MAAEENHTAAAIFNEEDLDDDDDDEEEEEDEDEEILTLTPNKPQSIPNDVVFDEDEEEEEEEDVNSPSSSSNLAGETLPTSAASQVTIAVPGDPTLAAAVPDSKRQRVEEPSRSVPEEKKPSAALDESRRLFQRLWTDEDEIELLQGFLEYTTQRGTAQHHHHDTALFYDQIKGKLQLEFNKNQLVEKLRRLKKKYRNVTNRISSGKEFAFKSQHDQSTFEISRKIWSNAGRVPTVPEDHAFEEEDANPSPNPNPNTNPNPNPSSNYHNNSGVDGNVNSAEKKTPRSRKRSQVKTPEKHTVLNNTQLGSSIPSLVEETVRSCLSPLFKELLHSATNGPCGVRGFGGMAAFNPLPLGFGGPSMLNFSGGDMVDEKWRKQQILELEVYAKRLELVQDQIKSALEELRSMGS